MAKRSSSFRSALTSPLFHGHAKVTMALRYLNVKDDYLQELIERKPLALAKG